MADVDAFSTAVSSTSLTLDLGLLLSVDTSAPRSTSARESTQALVNAIFGLPTTRHPDHGPLATLPAPSTPLPRAKAMPKPKPLTKWEKFAATKGIQKRKKDKLIYDEDTQTWVPRWGYGGANKKVEEQWIHEVKGDENPRALARKERMDRKGKNEKQRLRNEAAAKTQTSVDRNAAKASLDAAVLRSRASTASMGKFDRRLDGETKQKGIKRKFEAAEADTSSERAKSLAMLDKLGKPAPLTTSIKKKSRGQGDAGLVNTRKAVKFATDGSGANALRGKKK